MNKDNIIDGKKLAVRIQQGIKQNLKNVKTPKAVTICVGNEQNSKMYTQMKLKKAQQLGIDLQAVYFDKNTNFESLTLKSVLKFEGNARWWLSTTFLMEERRPQFCHCEGERRTAIIF